MAEAPTDIAVLLDVLENVEAAMAELYTWLARALVQDPEAAGFFADMGRDELRHRDLVQFQRQLVTKSRGAFGSVKADTAAMKTVVERVRAFQRDTPNPSLHQALVFVLELENNAAETHYRTAISESSPTMARFINSLAKADEHHAETLHQFARKRGVFLEWPTTSAASPRGSPD